MDIHQKIQELSDQLASLAKQQTAVSKQIIQLMDELEQLKKQSEPQRRIIEQKEVITPPSHKPPQPATTPPATSYQPKLTTNKKTTLEEFIGGNLISKIGILITIIGIFIGAKYAIEHNLISPAIRILLGYACGIVLIGIALRLKKKYEAYSSVLMGGGLAVLYFITYIAYSFYSMLPQLLAFAMMLLFTGATVYASLLYNRIIIAHLGLVGAYAIPMLLSDQSGRYAVLFTYISIINAGILVLSFKKYWKSLFYVSFVFTWIVYSLWFMFYRQHAHFNIAFTFLTVFFLIFYATFLAYKLIKKEQYTSADVALLLSNAFIFYGYGYGILNENESTRNSLGMFTLVNAAIHLVISLVIKRLKLADTALFYLLLGLVIAFVTIAIPVQLNGNWVTLLWTMEAGLVFFIGRTQGRQAYEKLAAVLSLLAFISLLDDWSTHAGIFAVFAKQFKTPIFNIVFLTGLLVALVQAGMLYVHARRPLLVADTRAWVVQFYNYVLPTLFLVTAYFLFELEIESYFGQSNVNAWDDQNQEPRLRYAASVLLYSMAFAGAVAYINERWIGREVLGVAAIIGIVSCIIVLLLHGLSVLNELSAYAFSSSFLIRYTVLAGAIMLLLLGQRSVQKYADEPTIRGGFGVLMHVTIVAIISFEYLYWMNMSSADVNEYKLGLSIVWSVYALMLVVMGINKKKKLWRLTGILFFLVTLIKLFVYDLNQTTTISKTISFISLGAILLLVSYLYNRYKDVIFMEDEKTER